MGQRIRQAKLTAHSWRLTDLGNDAKLFAYERFNSKLDNREHQEIWLNRVFVY